MIDGSHRANLAKEIRETIARLKDKNFKINPIMTPNSSLAVSRVSSAYKRYGTVLETALITAINQNSKHLQAWKDTFMVPEWSKKNELVPLYWTVWQLS